MSPLGSNKRPFFTFYTPREIEFIQPKNDVNFGSLHAAQKRHVGSPEGKSLVEMFPEDTRQGINRNANNYHSLNMLYKNPDAHPDNREYQDGVLVYKSEPSPVAGYFVVEVPANRKKDAEIVKKQLESLNPPVRDVKTNRIISGAYQDTTYSLSFEEVPDDPENDDSQLVRDPKPLKVNPKQAVKK